MIAVPRLLYLTHRLPYPPNKGDKISSFHMLRYFSKRYDVALASFIDDPGDIQYKSIVDEFCVESHYSLLSPNWRRFKSLSGVFAGRPLSVAYYKDRAFQRFVDHQIKNHQPDVILLYSGAMGRFVDGKIPAGTSFIYNMEDVDSEKFYAYGQGRAPFFSWIYRREGRVLLKFERQIAAQSTATTFISKDEAMLFKSRAPDLGHLIHYRTQGVDTAYYNPDMVSQSPYTSSEKPLVFTGVMDYQPNVEAVTWFVEAVMPQLRRLVPDISFYIVGMRPTLAIRKLGKRPGVVVTGQVDDVRPFLRHAFAACLPLQLARGIQNKALEAMAMEKTLIATPEAMTGIGTSDIFQPILAKDAKEFIAACTEVAKKPPIKDQGARAYCLEKFGWDANLAAFERLFVVEK